MTDGTPLDNPIWHALTQQQQSIARGGGLARRYASDTSPLSGLCEPTPAAFHDLRELVAPEEHVALFGTEPIDLPQGWEVDRAMAIDQMVFTGTAPSASTELLRLGDTDIPEMLALTALTEPGPFLPRTIDMGRYFGIRSADSRLAAMAGERLRLDGFTEVSAVCTHPDFRGKGYATTLVASVASLILREGRIPFLHATSDNPAKRVYANIGFEFRRLIHVTVIVPR